MYDLFADIQAELNYRRQKSMEENDIALRDYHYAFRGTSDDWCVPDSQFQEYLLLERKSKQDANSQVIPNTKMTVTINDNDVVTLSRGIESISMPLSEWQALQDAPDSIKEQASARLKPSYKGDQADRFLFTTPELKRAHEKALLEMEKWAKASASSYPKHK